MNGTAYPGRYLSRATCGFALLASLAIGGCLQYRIGADTAERKFCVVFFGWEGLATIAGLGLLWAAVGWKAAKTSAKWLGARWTCAIVAMMIIADIADGLYFQPHLLSHEMLRWGTGDYLGVMFANMRYPIGSTVVILLACRPWRFVRGQELPHMISLVLGLLLLNYVIAAGSYLAFAPIWIE
jgi:hypothetical protein